MTREDDRRGAEPNPLALEAAGTENPPDFKRTDHSALKDHATKLAAAMSTPREKIKQARATLTAAEAELENAQVLEAAVKACIALRTASGAVFNLCQTAKFPAAIHPTLEERVTAVHNAIALRYLGAGERIKALQRLDAQHWGNAKPSGYTSDEDLHHSVATWIFDCSGGFRGGRERDADEQAELAPILADLTAQMDEALGAELSAACLARWRSGHHDT